MKQEDIDKIMFSNCDVISLDTNKTYNQMGSGLGISISKSILKRLNHRFEVTSKEGFGTEVKILIDSLFFLDTEDITQVEESCSMTIPFIESNFKPHSFISSNELVIIEKNTQSPKKSFISHLRHKSDELIKQLNKDIVLIVEDNDQIRKAGANVLSKYISKNNLDFCVFECCDGIDLLNIIRKDQENQNRIKIIISDENMEYMCGSTAIGIIRELQICNKIKKIFISSLTAFTDDNTLEMIKRKGSDMIIEKPLNSDKIELLFRNFNTFK